MNTTDKIDKRGGTTEEVWKQEQKLAKTNTLTMEMDTSEE